MKKPLAEREKAARDAVVRAAMHYQKLGLWQVGWYPLVGDACARLAAIQKEKKRGRCTIVFEEPKK